jgi:hypothetical protein
MTEATKNTIGEAIIKLELTVNNVNLMLNVLGNAPYVQSATLIAQIQAQGVPQLKELEAAFEAVKAAEPKTEEAAA